MLLPVQIAPPVLDEMVIDGTTAVVSDITVLLLVAIGAVTHEFELVSTQLTTSPFTKALLLYVLLFIPTLFPLRFH